MVDMKLELVAVPVSDVDRAKAFYTDKIGFNADYDYTVSEEIRFVQLTPPGSACSIAIGKGIVEGEPGAAPRSATSRTSTGAASSSSPTPMATSGRCSSRRTVADRPTLSLRTPLNRATRFTRRGVSHYSHRKKLPYSRSAG
jgi:catechol 2,3-dioxygenase-like lactoylglutathione lyase family enzyme